MNELGDFQTRFLVLLRCHLAEVVHTTVHIRIPMAIRLCDGIDYHLWLLCGGSIIQIDQLSSVH